MIPIKQFDNVEVRVIFTPYTFKTQTVLINFYRFTMYVKKYKDNGASKTS